MRTPGVRVPRSTHRKQITVYASPAPPSRPDIVSDCSAVSGRSARLSVFVFVDALGWRLLERHPWFLEGLAEVRTSVETVLGYSCTCDPTILTGCPPQEHGHFSFFRFDPEASPFAGKPWWSRLPRALSERGRVRAWISRIERYRLGYSGYFNLYGVPAELLRWFVYTETRDLYQPGGIIGGQPTVFDRFTEAGIWCHTSDWRRNDAFNLAEAVSRAESGEPRCLYVYLSELDAELHSDGTDSPRITERLRYYDRELRALFAAACGAYDDVGLHVFSDHGMSDVVGTSDVRHRVEHLGLTFGGDYAAVYDSTLARFWFSTDDARAKVHSVLDRESCGRVLSRAELGALGCDFADERYGETIFLLDPGYVLDPSFMGEWVPRGMHGYHPSHPDTAAAYLSNVPGLAPPRHLTDLHDLMLIDAGVEREIVA